MKYENLKILSELRNNGSITEEEYQHEKAKILNDEEPKRSSYSYDRPLFGLSQNTFMMIMHLSQLAIFLAPIVGIAIPILMWVLQKDNNPTVDKQGKDIINFNISFLIYSAVLALTIVGAPLVIVLVIAYIILVVKTSINANNGKVYVPYPLTIQFIK